MTPKGNIIIGVPCFGDFPVEALAGWAAWIFHLGRRMPEYNFTFFVIPRKAQWRAKNAIALECRRGNYTHCLILDDDMDPSTDLDWLRVLLAHDKDIIGALYFQKGGLYHPVIMKEVERYESHNGTKIYGCDFYSIDELGCGLMKVDVLGGGCQLIKKHVFDKIIEPIFYEDGIVGQDIYFCKKARNAGFEVYVDTSVTLGHCQMERRIINGHDARGIWKQYKDSPEFQRWKEANPGADRRNIDAALFAHDRWAERADKSAR